jgi:hypothetical protein
MMLTAVRWIKLKEATQYASIGKARLINLVVNGIIRGAQDPDSKRGDWIFDRLSIDEYREAQMSQFSAREKALEIMRS